MKAYLASTAALALLTFPTTAFSQETAGEARPAPTDSDGALGEIVVTAQKRAENMQTVPIAITANTGEQLEARGIAGTMQLSVVTPGLNINETGGSFQPSIRGIGTSSALTENPVALFVDGVYIPQQRDGLREFEDVEQVAVLKGPQGTLSGRNATAGVIQITTKAPTFDLTGRVHADLDSYLTAKVGGYVSGGLTETIAASLAGSFTTQGKGWGKNRTTGTETFKIQHDVQVRGKLLFRPSESTDITLSADYTDWRRRLTDTRPTPGTQLGVPNPYVTSPLSSVYDNYSATVGFVALKGGGASVTVNQDAGAVRLTSITAYRDITSVVQSDGIPSGQPLLSVLQPSSISRSFSQELQVIGETGGPLDWMFGIYYFNYDNGVNPIIRRFGGFLAPLPTSVVRRETFATEHTESIAPFGEIKLEFLPDTHLTAGIRYTYEHRRLKGARIVNITGTGASTSAAYSGDIDASNPTFRLGLDHRLTGGTMLYATFNTGFKSGGYNVGAPNVAPYNPEKLTAWEAGFKSELFDRRLRLNAAAFYYKYTNLQVTQYVNLIQTVTNGPKAEVYGLNVDFEARPLDGLQLSGGFELKHSEFTDYNNAVFGTVGPGGVGATLAPGDATGNRLPQAQDFSGTFAADYRHALGDGSVDFNVTANYNGDFYFQADNRIRQAPYTILNATITWNLPGDAASLKLWAKNLLDERYQTTAIQSAFGFVSGYNAQPRTFGGTIAYSF
jgi:outer membrane receptor protein involved in Fe transport